MCKFEFENLQGWYMYFCMYPCTVKGELEVELLELVWISV